MEFAAHSKQIMAFGGVEEEGGVPTHDAAIRVYLAPRQKLTGVLLYFR